MATAADWYVKNYPTDFTHATNPVWFVPMAAGLFTIATFVHHTPLKKLTGALAGNVQLRWDAYRQSVKNLEAEVATESVPAPVAEAPDSFSIDNVR